MPSRPKDEIFRVTRLSGTAYTKSRLYIDLLGDMDRYTRDVPTKLRAAISWDVVDGDTVTYSAEPNLGHEDRLAVLNALTICLKRLHWKSVQIAAADTETQRLIEGRFREAGFRISTAKPVEPAPVPGEGSVQSAKPDGTWLLHVTSAEKLDEIRAEGMRALSYWSARSDIHDYYTEVVEDEGDEPVTLMVPLNALDPGLLEPDHPGLQEPITTVLDKSEMEVWREWKATDRSWKACLDLIGSVRYRGAIPADMIQIGEMNGACEYEGRPLVETASPGLR
jgi:hypothetical protein